MENHLIELSPNEISRYTSQIKLCEIGISGQKKLKSSAIAVVGAGGLGCAAMLYLTAGGIGKIGVIDHDRVELKNLQRQILYQPEDIGILKCEAAIKRLSSINPHVVLEGIATSLTTNNSKILQNYDLVIDATDNFSARYLINDACVELSKPFVHGSIKHFEGQVAIFNSLHKNGKRTPDYRSLYPVPPNDKYLSSCSEDGVISPLPGIIGSIQALEAIKSLLEIEYSLSGKLLILNVLTWQTRIYHLCRNPEDDEGPFELNTQQMQQMILDKVDLHFIDIREESEYHTISYEASHIPFSQLINYPIKLPPNKVLILLCQKGLRSLQAAKLLRENTHSDQKIYSFKGGIENLQ